MSSQARRIKRLQTDALAFIRAGESEKALEKLAQLEQLEPREPDWPRRAAECHRLLGETESYLDALARAAKAYVAMDLVVKAIAICKMMLAVDPKHPAALAWMNQLRSPGPQATAAVSPPAHRQVVEKAEPTGTVPDASTATPLPSAARRLVAKKGLVAVARMVARRAPREPSKSPSIRVEAPALPPLRPSQPESEAPPFIEEAEPVASQSAVVCDAPVSAEPVGAEPVGAEPVGAEPVGAEPVGAEPVGAEPVGAGPAEESPTVSSPPLAVGSELRLLVPGSCEWPAGKQTPSGMFRLAIDDVEPSADVRALNQARGILPAIPLFAEMDPRSLEGLVRQSRLMHLRSGEVVFEQDDTPDCLYVVVNGSVAMFDEAVNVELYRVGENEFFGEGALISNDLQPTTARAAEDCDLLAFDRESMRECIVDNLNVVPVLLRFLRSRMLEHLVRTSPLFAHLDTAERRALSRKFEFIEVKEGAVLIQQGTRSPGLFVLLCGAVDVVRNDGEREQWLATLERGGMFGEMSLLGRGTAEADVRSVSAGFALLLPAAAFRDVIMTHPPLLEVLSAMSEERIQANERRLRSETARGALPAQ